MPKTVAIHQPNFFPWLGYFDKIARADVFVVMDDVQFPKKGGTWCNRVKLLVGGFPNWVTAAVDRSFSGTRRINEVMFAADPRSWEKVGKTLSANYSKHPFYAETMDVVAPLLASPEPHVALYNTAAISAVAMAMGFDISKVVMASTLSVSGSSNELLCALTRAAGGDTYMYGGGAAGYQDETVFAREGVALQAQNFVHPTYGQHRRADFAAGLSVIDAAMNLGWAGVAAMLRSRGTTA
jgi:hypothetical protein